MASAEVLSSYIKKLRHPLKEIRERALKLLLAKLQLGWELEDELDGTRELFEALLAWFHVQEPTLQDEALYLLLSTIKSKAGAYIAREYGIKDLLAKLNRLRHKIDPGSMELFDDVIDNLRFLNTVESQEDVTVPQLNLPSGTTSETDASSTTGYYNVDPNIQTSREPSSVCTSEIEITKFKDKESSEGIRILLFPWVDLCTSDTKTMLLIENALRVVKSTRRCCRFIRDVFLRDFPAEIFLNRPNIVQNLLAMVGGTNGGKLSEPLNALLCITKELCVRMKQLCCLELVHDTEKIYDISKDIDDQVNIDLEQFASETGFRSPCLQTDGLEPLRQLPAPLFALEALQAILSTMARSLVLLDPNENAEVLDTNDLNICLSLIENLIDLLLGCVDETFWKVDHKTMTQVHIAHKSCMTMRLLGDLLNKYRTSFLEDPERKHHRIAWIRLISCSEILLIWASESALSLKSLVEPLKFAQLDQAIHLFYPELAERINDVMENENIPIDKEYKSKHIELTKLFQSMNEAVKFMKNKDNCRDSKQVLNCIRNSIAILDLHLNENFLKDIGGVIFEKVVSWDMKESDWCISRSICLTLMSHSLEQVRGMFYGMLASMVKSCLVGEDDHQVDKEKCLNLLCDVGVLTEICCHGLCDSSKEVSTSASEIMLYLLRGRLVLSERCWWRLLASCLPILPLLHVHVAPDTPLGQAIVKSLEPEIADCMGVPQAEVFLGQVRLLFVKCPPIQLDAAHALCHLLDEPKYLPPKESLRADVLINALRRVLPQDFNVDLAKYSSKPLQTTGLTQILDVLKQDLNLEELSESEQYYNKQPALEPSLRRATLQQLSVLMREPESHDTFVQFEGINIIVAILRMSLLVDDYLAFPECAISCVSVLNSICFGSRHTLAKIADLPALLLRVILIFPANESTVVMCAQVLAILSWSGFALQELDQDRKRVVALPASVVERTNLPFECFTYWGTSANAVHSSVEWLQTTEEWRTAIRTRWAHAWNPSLPPNKPPPGPLTLRLSRCEQDVIKATCPMNTCGGLLSALQGASSHKDVHRALALLEGYTNLIPKSTASSEVSSLPWSVTLSRFLAPPASPRDITLLTNVLKFVVSYMDCVTSEGESMEWIRTSFFDDNNSIISLLSRDQLYPQQSAQDHIELTQLHIYIVKVVLRCVVVFEFEGKDGVKLESLLKILLCCLDGIDLKNFHVLGYLNELTRCVRYILNTPLSPLSEQTLIDSLQVLSKIIKGVASGGGRKGQRCRLDALLGILAVLNQIAISEVPVQRWSEHLHGEVIRALVWCARAPRGELRAAALRAAAALAHHASLLPQLLHAIEEESLSQFAFGIFSQRGEAAVVRAAAAALLTAVAARATPHSDVYECDILQQLCENNFIEHCIEILVEFAKENEYNSCFEPNIPLSVLERRSQLEVRAQKTSQVQVTPAYITSHRPPTAGLVIGLSDVIHNVVAFKKCPVQAWNELGLFRLMFKCTSWSNGAVAEVAQTRASICRALCRVADCSGKVRATLANTKDCLYSLLMSLTPLDDESDSNTISAYTQALFLLSTLLTERSASDQVWREIQERCAEPFFTLLLQCLEFDGSELQEAGMCCLTQLTQSASKKQSLTTSDISKVDLLDNLKSPYFELNRSEDCQPEFLVEEICKTLMGVYQNIALEKRKFQCAADDNWSRTCSCLSSIFALSSRARLYGVHRVFARTLLATLQGLRDHLSITGKTADVIRSANNNPVLRSLNWLLTLIASLMSNCLPAKDAFADNGVAASLGRLWPWGMMTEELRETVLCLLVIFSNDCRKAWSSMSSCVGGRSLITELSALSIREASLAARGRPERALCLSLRALAHAAPDNHVRAQIIKNGALTCVYKIRVAERSRHGRNAAEAWAQLAEAIARFPDGAASLLELRSVLTSHGTRGLIMPAIAHAAHFHRTAFLQAADLLELLSGTLLTGDTAEVASAARAVWALAVNNHKAKLALRSAGVASAVQSALERLQRARRPAAAAAAAAAAADAADARAALQLLAYTNTVLQPT